MCEREREGKGKNFLFFVIVGNFLGAYQKKIKIQKKESKEKKLNDFLWCVTCVINLQEKKDKKGKFCKAKEARKKSEKCN